MKLICGRDSAKGDQRVSGSRVLLAKAIVAALSADLLAHGAVTIEKARAAKCNAVRREKNVKT